MDDHKRAFLIDLFLAAVAAADPALTLPRHLPVPPESGRIIVLAAGKAAGAMAEAAERHYAAKFGLGPDRLTGLAVARHGYGRPTRVVRMVEAGHPVPDQAGLDATAETLALARSAGPNDLVLVLLSGGGSANWVAPARGLTLADKQLVSRALLASGATIDEINTVRKHLSLIKGGRLAAAVHPARLMTLAISDVPG
ncbi:MAG: glycerate-2-kinase family protein, partial [Hyphomicrobiales bacterium]|nr:glycerate-2-kinase family protein [Hyphomicrobiales bacterium]